MNNFHIKYKDFMPSLVTGGTSNGDLDLKINRGHLLAMGNVPTKLHKPMLIPSQVID
jgi:hypothetical protein